MPQKEFLPAAKPRPNDNLEHLKLGFTNQRVVFNRPKDRAREGDQREQEGGESEDEEVHGWDSVAVGELVAAEVAAVVVVIVSVAGGVERVFESIVVRLPIRPLVIVISAVRIEGSA